VLEGAPVEIGQVEQQLHRVARQPGVPPSVAPKLPEIVLGVQTFPLPTENIGSLGGIVIVSRNAR
jgi:hypothetical protein